MDKHDINLNTGQVKFSNSMMGIFEDLKTNEVDPEQSVHMWRLWEIIKIKTKSKISCKNTHRWNANISVKKGNKQNIKKWFTTPKNYTLWN